MTLWLLPALQKNYIQPYHMRFPNWQNASRSNDVFCETMR